ncbi:MAG: DNA recombination/repair protein RecA, partial [Thermoleophilia bacterium]|nr:DNA recombination/repair protein RecA [Thermoleophilia bacterium]
LDLGVDHAVLTKSGAYFSYGEERLGQGRNQARAFLSEHPDIAHQIESEIRERAGIPVPTIEPVAEQEDTERVAAKNGSAD